MSDHIEKMAPKAISLVELAEIVQIPQIREAWGLDNETTAEDFASVCYGARFDFSSGGPGYVGDLYMLYGDAISGVPIAIIRDSENRLQIVEDD